METLSHEYLQNWLETLQTQKHRQPWRTEYTKKRLRTATTTKMRKKQYAPDLKKLIIIKPI